MACLPVFGQEAVPDSSVKFDLPADSPLALVSTAMGESHSSTRGGAMVLDLHMSLTLRNFIDA
ncbi:MAG: hypothetical protein ABJC09_05060, partial [Terriglobia bacterium]